MANIIRSIELNWVGNTHLKCQTPHTAEVLSIIMAKGGPVLTYKYNDREESLPVVNWFRVYRDGDELDTSYTTYVTTLFDAVNSRFYYIFTGNAND